jgi:hypothetical protein
MTGDDGHDRHDRQDKDDVPDLLQSKNSDPYPNGRYSLHCYNFLTEIRVISSNVPIVL